MILSFYDVIKSHDDFDLDACLKSVTGPQVQNVLVKKELDITDFLALLSQSAVPFLESMARRAHRATKSFFGNIIFLFTPLYISNYCDNSCEYCSFAKHQDITRKKLSLDEVQKEAERISGTGLRHILVLTGESRTMTPLSYIKESIDILRRYFSSISIEIYPLDQKEYGELVACGVDSLTIYQEVYDEKVYKESHKQGPKNDYAYRLDAPERALRQKMHGLNIGALLGLSDPVKEAFYTALHIKHLQDHYPEAELSISLPRVRPLVSDFHPPFPVTDRQFVQMLVAFRIWNPSIGITVSTRESRSFRNNILRLGVTKMSAGVSTAVGGHTGGASESQFEIADTRSVQEMERELLELGYQPVLHDWNFKMLDGTKA